MAQTKPLVIGIDVGGTFTDVIAYDTQGLHVAKVPTTTSPAGAVLQGLELLGEGVKGTSLFSHATTIATNALLTRAGLAKTAFVTNHGFRDVLEIGRQRRPEIYDLRSVRPQPLVSRRDRFTVRCRVGARGEVIEPLSGGEAARIAGKIIRGGFQSVGICFLNSYVNPFHEFEMRDILIRKGFDGNISLSSEVAREYREFERSSTTAVNAVLVPLVSGYLARLQKSLSRRGMHAPVYVMNSDGGMSTAAFASKFPVCAIESGPAAGVIASMRLSRALALPAVLTFDMGGTTAKAGVVIRGEPEVVQEFEAAGRTHSGRSIVGSGYVVRGSFIDLAEVSAGGGTVAFVDDGGALVVGPRSAGSDPGPACYGRGGTEPTVTDANVLLGRLSPEGLLGGRMKIRPDLARKSLENLGRRLGSSAAGTASGVIRLVNNSMSKAISIVSVERGRDPREFTLFAFGGSGPVHSCDLAEDLGIVGIFVPFHAGLFSAYGLLAADLTRTFVRPGSDWSSLGQDFAALERNAREVMRGEGFNSYLSRRFVEARYKGQSHELLLRFRRAGDLRDAFSKKHRELYGYSASDPLEAVNLILKATVPTGIAPSLGPLPRGRTSGSVRREAWLAGNVMSTEVLTQEGLQPGQSGEGPCILEGYDSTLVVNPGWSWKVEREGVSLSR